MPDPEEKISAEFIFALIFHLVVGGVGVFLMVQGWDMTNSGRLIAGAILVGTSQLGFRQR